MTGDLKIRASAAEGTETLKAAVEKQEEAAGAHIERNAKTELERFSPLFNPGQLLNMPASEMTADQAASAWAMLDVMESVASGRKEQIRLRLFEIAETQGVADEKGSKRLFVEGTKIGKRKNVGSKPDEKGFKTLLQENQIPFSEAFDEVKALQMNLAKIEYLVDSGRLKKEAVDALKKITYTIELEPSEALASYLTEAKSKLAGLPAKGESGAAPKKGGKKGK